MKSVKFDADFTAPVEFPENDDTFPQHNLWSEKEKS